jgi:hypothetical protein
MTNSTGVHFSVTISTGHPRALISWIKSTRSTQKINSTKIKSTKSAAIFFVARAAGSIVLEDEPKWHLDGVDIARLNAVDQSLKLRPCHSGAPTALNKPSYTSFSPVSSRQERVLSSRPSRQLWDCAFLVAHCGQRGL